MKIRTFIVLSALIFAGFGLKAQKRGAQEANNFTGGVVYSLPRTGIRIYVEATQEKFFRGPYAEYASKYLGVKDVQSSDAESWKIVNVKLETFGEPDPAEVHKATGVVGSMLSLSENGTLLGVNCNVKSEPVKIFTSDFTPGLELPRAIWPDLSMHSYFAGKKDSLNHSANKMKTIEEKVAEAANDIFKLRKRKAYTLAAKYDKLPPDGKAYEVMVTELDKIIEDYESLFLGKSFKTTHSFSFDVVPDAKGNKAIVAFRFSPSSGVLPESNVSGKPIMLDLDANGDLTKSNETSNVPKAGESSASGLFYRAPGLVTVRLLNGTDILAQARLAMGQYGTLVPIPDGLLNGEFSIELHSNTGAIKRIGNK